MENVAQRRLVRLGGWFDTRGDSRLTLHGAALVTAEKVQRVPVQVTIGNLARNSYRQLVS